MKGKHSMIGKRFNRLIVVSEAAPYVDPSGTRRRMWLCVCDCQTTTTVQTDNLRHGHTRSCGCLHIERARARGEKNKTHGLSKTPTYISWAMMIQRCTNQRNPGFPNWGGRGIAVDPRWRSFAHFLADMGERLPGTSIDRINNDLGYFPGNCRWATPKEQANNQRPRRKRVA